MGGDSQRSWNQRANPSCMQCGKYTIVQVSKSEKNPNRQYYKCTTCDEFVGWCNSTEIIQFMKELKYLVRVLILAVFIVMLLNVLNLCLKS